MLESKEREINGAKYTSTTHPARPAIALGTDILQFIGPALSTLGGAIKIEDGKIVDVKGDVIQLAVQALIAQMNSDKVVSLILRILECTTRVDPVAKKRQEVSKGEVFDVVYAGNLGELVGALRFALEVSIGRFFDGSRISGLFAKALAMADRVIADAD